MDYPVVHNETTLQFEISLEEQQAFLQYRLLDDKIWLMHTEVPKTLEGRGIASALAHYAFEWSKTQNKKIKVLCPFVAVFLKRHPEYNALVVN